MKMHLFFFSLLLVYTINSRVIGMKPTMQKFHVMLAQRINKYIQSHKNFSGALLIAHEGKIILKKCYGFANCELRKPNTPQTRFRIASITKTFTALAIMKLQEQGLLHVQDPISHYLPDYPHGNQITIHHLLTHTSGIPNYYKYFADICNLTKLKKIVSIIQHWPLEFEPGSKYMYSNSGYLLLAYIIEKVSGKTYNEFLDKNIFKPLNMHNSGQDKFKNYLSNHAHCYIKEKNTIKNSPSINSPITLLGNGDLYASLNDLYKLDQALHKGKVISQQSFDCMTIPYVTINGKRSHGYGWFIDRYHNKKVIEYSGCLVGSLSKYMRFIDDKITIILLSNVEDMYHFDKICNNIPAFIFNK